MAWIFSAASEALPKGSPPGSVPSPTVRSTDTLKGFSCREWKTATYLERRSGTTCARCGGPFFPGWTSSTEASPARTSVLLALEGAWLGSEAASSGTSFASLASVDRDSSSWRTSQRSLLGVSDRFSWNSMHWGSMRDGRLYQPPRLEPRTSESDSGSSRSPEARRSGSSEVSNEDTLELGKPSRVIYPTPTASVYGTSNNGNPGDGRTEYRTKGKLSLESMARHGLWPTPRVKGNYASPRQGSKEGTGLATAVRLWPTPRASDGDKGSPNQKGSRGDLTLPSAVRQDQSTGSLNPEWVEWLMGYRVGWTELSPWAMQWFRSARGRRSKGSRGSPE
jgi:hypothetical protein